MGNDPDMLDAFPAQELVRKEGRKAPRAWHKRWTEAGGTLHEGRMVALKTDAVWTKINRFGTPWPPFDFQSGMGLVELDRDEAEVLGLITMDDVLEPAELPFTENMQADVSSMSPRYVAGLKAIFGEQVSIVDGKAMWVGSQKPVMNTRTYSRDTIGRFAADHGGPTGATGDAAKDARVAERLRRKGPLNSAEQITIIDRVVKRTESGPQIGEDFGAVSKEAVALAAPHADLSGYVKRIEPDAVRHIKRRHSDGATELKRNQLPVSEKDFAMLPVVLDKPERVYPGEPAKDGNPTLWFERGNGPKQRLLVHVRKGRERLAVITFMKERSPAAL